MFRIIHISDLHFKTDLYQPRVIRELCSDIKIRGPVNAVVFSGDAAAKGKTEISDVEKILAEFVSHVRAAAGHDIPFLICPGNHDIDLQKRLKIYEPVFSGITSPQKANELTTQATSEDAKPLWSHIEGFRTLARAIDEDAFSKHPLFYTKKITANGVKIGFACINSAWMTKGGGNADYGQLYIGEYILDQARKELEDVDLRIAVMHHPLDWLAPEEKSLIQRYLTLNFHAYFCGHKHDNNADTLKSNIGSLFTSNTGCVYHSNEYFNGYSIIDVDLPSKKWIINAREYYFQREVFDTATRFAPNGCWESPFSNTWSSIQISIPGEVTKAINERANSLLLSYSSSEVAPKSIGALFVEPPLSKMSEKELLAKSKGDAAPTGAYETLSNLSQQDDAIFFIGKREAGKSLLLHHIAANCFQSFRGNARIGVVVDINAIKKFTEAQILEQTVEFCGSEIPRRDIIKLLSSGEILVCIDNIKIHDQKTIDLIRKFIESYPKVRYIFAASEELLDNLSGNNIPNLGLKVTKIFIHSFRARHTKELVKKWFGSGDLAINSRVKNINNLLDRLRVPRTPFLVSVLSWVLEQRPNSNVVNRASAIEVLIEGLLEKFKESKARREIDSTIQQHFLAEFSQHLNEKDVDWIDRLNFDGFVFDYFKNRGLSVSTEGFAVELIRKGLLYATDDRVGFKFDCFRAFFLAKKFSEVPSLWHAALIPGRVGRYITELDLFTGLHRDRTDVLKAAKELCTKTFLELKIEFPIHEIDKFIDTGVFSNSIFLNGVEKNILNSPAEILESHHEKPDLVSVDHEESRKRKHLPDMGEIGQFLESLRAFSIILRNSELVNDVELKRECFDFALEKWANTTIAAIIESEKHSKINSTHKSNKENTDLPNKQIINSAISKAMITQMIVAVMSDSLSTPKLEIFSREKTKDSRTLVRVLAVFLCFDAADDNSIELAKSLLKDFRGNSFVLEMLFFKTLSTYIQKSQENINPKLRDLIGDIMVQMQGGTARDVAFVKSNFLVNIDKNLLIKDFNNKD